jgi:hypothetical protein
VLRLRVFPGVFFSGSKRAAVRRKSDGRLPLRTKMERLIFESVILDFVITTIRFFEIQKVEVSEN